MTLYESCIQPDSSKHTEQWIKRCVCEWVIESFTHCLFETIYIGGAKIHKVIDTDVLYSELRDHY